MKKIAIYLAGSIKKQHEKADETFWTEEHMDFIKESLPQFEVSFLNPAFRTDNLSDQFSVFGRDMMQVFCSDLVFVDARDRRGLGVGAEMMWAKINKIPVLIWAPKDTHYHRSFTTILDMPVENFIHPFVESLADGLVENLLEGVQWIEKKFNELPQAKGIEHIHAAMRHYKNSQLHHDVPMHTLLNGSDELKTKVDAI